MAYRRLSGFTLFELLIVITVMGVLAFSVTPSLSEVVKRNEKNSLIVDFYSTLALAQSESVKRRLPVNIKPIDSTAWHKGWITHLDPDRNGLPNQSSDIFNKIQMSEGIGVVFKNTASITSITFLPDGLITVTPSSSIVRFYSCSPHDKTSEQSVRIYQSGNFKIDHEYEVSC